MFNNGKSPGKYEPTMVSHGFKVVRIGFRPSAVGVCVCVSLFGEPPFWPEGSTGEPV